MIYFNREIKFTRPHLSIEHLQKYEMNLPISIHDKKKDAIVETLQETRAERSIETTSDINIELYSAGFFDGLTGLDAEHGFRQSLRR